jgi:hypothetical protein
MHIVKNIAHAATNNTPSVCIAFNLLNIWKMKLPSLLEEIKKNMGNI